MINTLKNIRLRALALRSSIHNEHQLSAIELAGMCAKKTNELIDVVNELCDVINNSIGDGSLVLNYNAQTESLNLEGGKVNE